MWLHYKRMNVIYLLKGFVKCKYQCNHEIASWQMNLICTYYVVKNVKNKRRLIRAQRRKGLLVSSCFQSLSLFPEISWEWERAKESITFILGEKTHRQICSSIADLQYRSQLAIHGLYYQQGWILLVRAEG